VVIDRSKQEANWVACKQNHPRITERGKNAAAQATSKIPKASSSEVANKKLDCLAPGQLNGLGVGPTTSQYVDGHQPASIHTLKEKKAILVDDRQSCNRAACRHREPATRAWGRALGDQPATPDMCAEGKKKFNPQADQIVCPAEKTDEAVPEVLATRRWRRPRGP